MIHEQQGSIEPVRSTAEKARPDMVQRATLADNCKIVMVAVFAAMPLALWSLMGGIHVPFVLAVSALGVAVSSYAAIRQNNNLLALKLQVLGLAALGIFLTAIDAGLADFGLAIGLLAPVLASILGERSVERLAWVLAVGVVAVAAVTSSLAPAFEFTGVSLSAALTYGVAAAIVAVSAHRLGKTVEGFRKAQLDTFRHLVEHLQNAVLRFSQTGELLFISRGTEDLFGCQRYELASSGVLDRVHVQDRPLYMTAFADANRSGLSRSIEVRMRKDDTADMTTGIPGFVWVEISLSPVTDGHGKADKFEVIALMRDITRRKAQEEAMLAARREAEEASFAKSHFLATVGHELRTPLNAIVGFSEMMTNGIAGQLDDGPREYAGLIHKSGMHLLEIVNMLLDMSKIEAGKFDLQLESFDAEDLVRPCLEIVEPMAAERNIRLVADVPGKLPMVTGDERAYRQIILNLMSNAIKFSPEGADVTLSVRRQGLHLNLSVTDHGIGMDTATISRLGEPFFQAQRDFTRQYEGTGLGLSIVKGLIELHEGRLHIRSAPGKGTTMTVLTPISGPVPAQPADPVVTPIPARAGSQYDEEFQTRKSIAQ